jgi:hypothetical protein
MKTKTTEGKKDYSKEFENMLGNPIEQVNGLIAKAHTLSAKQKFINRFGEDPVDVLGQDWENCIEDYKEMVNDEELLIDK